MAADPKQLIAVGAVAVAGLAAGFGVAKATGGSEPPERAAQAAGAELPAVPERSTVRVARLGDAAALPARQTRRRRISRKAATPATRQQPVPDAGAQPRATPVPDSNSSAPPAPRPQPAAPSQPQPSNPQPVRTPAVGGGTGGGDP